jgi:hypothetical protein
MNLRIMHIYRRHKCAFTEESFHIMRIFSFYKCTYTEAKIRIYGSSLLYMRILSSVYVHLQKTCIYEKDSIYVHFGFCICAFTEAKMRIYG